MGQIRLFESLRETDSIQDDESEEKKKNGGVDFFIFPQVYYFSERAKCCLMENGDFEACFYDGAKVCCSHGASSRVHVIQSDGKQATFESTETLDRTGSVEMNELYRHTKEVRPPHLLLFFPVFVLLCLIVR